jgi:hypothetical protein
MLVRYHCNGQPACHNDRLLAQAPTGGIDTFRSILCGGWVCAYSGKNRKVDCSQKRRSVQ